jgi:hypothetical protein
MDSLGLSTHRATSIRGRIISGTEGLGKRQISELDLKDLSLSSAPKTKLEASEFINMVVTIFGLDTLEKL